MPCPVSSALTARIPKNNALLVTIFLISGFIYITSELLLVKVYVREQGNMTFLETGKYIKQLFRIINAKAERFFSYGKNRSLFQYECRKNSNDLIHTKSSAEVKRLNEPSAQRSQPSVFDKS